MSLSSQKPKEMANKSGLHREANPEFTVRKLSLERRQAFFLDAIIFRYEVLTETRYNLRNRSGRRLWNSKSQYTLIKNYIFKNVICNVDIL